MSLRGLLRLLFLLGSSLWLLSKFYFYHHARGGQGIVLYATDRQYFCNALINVARLKSFKSRAQVVVLLPEPFLGAPGHTPIGRLVSSLRALHVKFVPLHLERAGLRVNDVTYEHSLQKLEILKLPYSLLLYFDSDGLILQNPDGLFDNTAAADLIMPEAYYAGNHDDKFLYSSAFMVVRPSDRLYKKAQELVRLRDSTDFDMEIFDKLTHDPAVSNMTLPYRHHLLLTGLFRNHASYTRGGTWNAQQEWDKAMYIHFSDAPIPKPWIDDRGATYAQHGPKCSDGGQDCDEVRIWRNVYNMFRQEMRDLCPSPKELDT